MKRSRAGVVVALLLAIALTPLILISRRSAEFPPPVPRTLSSTAANSFVGAESCAECHATQFAAWQQSTHGRAGGPPSPKTVIAPFYSSSPIRFANATVTPRARGDVYEFVIRQPGEKERVFRIDGVIGGGHIYGGGTQGFVTSMPDGTVRFLPFEWSRQNRTWFCNTNSRSGRGWAPISPDMRIEECGDWPPVRAVGDIPRFANCQSCHASQATIALDTAAHRYRTSYTSLAINCESCHGPGARHVDLARGKALTTSDIGFAALGTLNKDASIRVCYQCHALKDQLRAGFVSGDTVTHHYSFEFPLLGDRPLTPDGRTRTFAYQEGHSFSDCYLNGGMTCVSCHDPHSQKYRDVNGAVLNGRFDDRQCTSCHASKAENPRAHTKHQTEVQCTSCHMPSRQERDTRPMSARFASRAVVQYSRSDHTISIPRPALDSAVGFAAACATCHANMSVAEQENAIRAKWGEIKPLPRVVASQYQVSRQLDADSAASLLLDDSPEDARAYARFAGVSLFLDAYVSPDAPLSPRVNERLRALAKATDVDTRAAALATLHLSSGAESSTRRVLAKALRKDGDDDLRARWALALAYMGDRFSSQGNSASSAIAFKRALEVQPDNARIALSLANTLRDAGQLDSAAVYYRRSIEHDGAVPLAWVNFGIAQLSSGDTTSAIKSLSRAADLDSAEPLAWFNLANVQFVRGDLDRAAAMYQRALDADPSIALAHFQLARIALIRKDERSALFSLRRGLAFDTTDASAVEMARVLSKRLGTPADR